jgi:tRNA(fMet)-specific endonuclease VapC
VVTFELWYGVAKSTRPQTHSQRLETFLAGPIIVLPFDDEDEDARIAGSIRAALEVSGKPIRAYDVLIAGQALARQLINLGHGQSGRVLAGEGSQVAGLGKAVSE